MHPSAAPRRFSITPESSGAWVALHPDYNDIETGVTDYQLKTNWADTLLLQLPASLRWALTQRYQLRISWPANVRTCANAAPSRIPHRRVSPGYAAGRHANPGRRTAVRTAPCAYYRACNRRAARDAAQVQGAAGPLGPRGACFGVGRTGRDRACPDPIRPHIRTCIPRRHPILYPPARRLRAAGSGGLALFLPRFSKFVGSDRGA